jgi:serine/threonine protein kinase
MELHALLPGYHLAEYRIEKLLGEGGFGLTYLAFDTHLDKQVAIKEYMPGDFCVRQNSTTIVPNSEAAKPDYEWGLNAFIIEAKTLAKFDDTNIVRIYRFFKENGTAYLVMEYCEGGCLSERYSQSNPMSETQVQQLLSPIMNGLQLVHEGGVLHRDIKPDNLMFRGDGTPVLIDFGAARQLVVSKSKPVTALLTPGYAPLEQYGSKADRLGPWTDIYSLAAVAYSCLTGKVPPDASDRVIEDEIETLAQSSDASNFLKSLDKALSIQSINRPQNLTDWYGEWKDESQVPTEPEEKPTPEPTPKPEQNAELKQSDDVIEMAGADDAKAAIEEESLRSEATASLLKAATAKVLPLNTNKKVAALMVFFLLLAGGGYVGNDYYQAEQARLAKAEQARLAKAEEARLAKAEEARLAKAEEARLAKAEQVRLAKAEQARLAKAEEVRLAKAEEARLAKAEEARLAKAEEARLAKAEEVRLAKAEEVRLAKAEEARLAKAEQERLAKTAERPPPESLKTGSQSTQLTEVIDSMELPVWVVGDYWKLKGDNYESESWVVGETVFKGMPCYVVEQKSSGLTFELFYDKATLSLKQTTFESAGNSHVQSFEHDIIEGKKWPMIVGNKWKTKYPDYISSSEVVGTETITTLVGKLFAFKVIRSLTNNKVGFDMSETLWYSPALKNLVLSENITSYHEKTRKLMKKSSSSMEVSLIEFNVNP